MLKTFFLPKIKNNPLFERIIFMQERAPPHFGRVVSGWLDESPPAGSGGAARLSGPLALRPHTLRLFPLGLLEGGFVLRKASDAGRAENGHLEGCPGA